MKKLLIVLICMLFFACKTTEYVVVDTGRADAQRAKIEILASNNEQMALVISGLGEDVTDLRAWGQRVREIWKDMEKRLAEQEKLIKELLDEK